MFKRPSFHSYLQESSSKGKGSFTSYVDIKSNSDEVSKTKRDCHLRKIRRKVENIHSSFNYNTHSTSVDISI